MDRFLEGVELPALSVNERNGLESRIALEELQKAVAEMSNQKAPGPDGLPLETYKYYGGGVTPRASKNTELGG